VRPVAHYPHRHPVGCASFPAPPGPPRRPSGAVGRARNAPRPRHASRVVSRTKPTTFSSFVRTSLRYRSFALLGKPYQGKRWSARRALQHCHSRHSSAALGVALKSATGRADPARGAGCHRAESVPRPGPDPADAWGPDAATRITPLARHCALHFLMHGGGTAPRATGRFCDILALA